MRILGRHQQSRAFIRSLAITCHALDFSAERLFYSGTYRNASEPVRAAYDELLSRNLLHMAVAIRTNMYQGTLSDPDDRFLSPCGFLDVHQGGAQESKRFTIKDVCDKIIHATAIERDVNKPDEGRTVLELRGKHGSQRWTLSISIELFCEYVLSWLDESEVKKAKRSGKQRVAAT